jgi:hypothetical protein
MTFGVAAGLKTVVVFSKPRKEPTEGVLSALSTRASWTGVADSGVLDTVFERADVCVTMEGGRVPPCCVFVPVVYWVLLLDSEAVEGDVNEVMEARIDLELRVQSEPIPRRRRGGVLR